MWKVGPISKHNNSSYNKLELENKWEKNVLGFNWIDRWRVGGLGGGGLLTYQALTLTLRTVKNLSVVGTVRINMDLDGWN